MRYEVRRNTILLNAPFIGNGEFTAMDVIGLLCGMLFWGVVILAWIAYLSPRANLRARIMGRRKHQ